MQISKKRQKKYRFRFLLQQLDCPYVVDQYCLHTRNLDCTQNPSSLLKNILCHSLKNKQDANQDIIYKPIRGKHLIQLLFMLNKKPIQYLNIPYVKLSYSLLLTKHTTIYCSTIINMVETRRKLRKFSQSYAYLKFFLLRFMDVFIYNYVNVYSYIKRNSPITTKNVMQKVFLGQSIENSFVRLKRLLAQKIQIFLFHCYSFQFDL
eukprot:TRINITY_DN384_c0_g1_i16.p1 TRINITY_DN384_c0_g1~~TRINITY_DN384_c0_g1_i16.p1  ORF type:complete len:206 (+),score=-16.14 TRINITY_DN384_c0_g1_i16:189-806(+)